MDGMSYDDAKRLLRDCEEDLAVVRSWPPDRPHKLDWERAVYSRRDGLRRIVRRRAGETDRAEVEALLGSR